MNLAELRRATADLAGDFELIITEQTQVGNLDTEIRNILVDRIQRRVHIIEGGWVSSVPKDAQGQR